MLNDVHHHSTTISDVLDVFRKITACDAARHDACGGVLRNDMRKSCTCIDVSGRNSAAACRSFSLAHYNNKVLFQPHSATLTGYEY
jgi:hypothetical protein